MLLNPRSYDPAEFDATTRRLLRATIEHFESRGKGRLCEDYHAHAFYQDFLDFAAEQGLFTTFFTPARDGQGHPDKRWDTARIAALAEILGFYGLQYWYPMQVLVLGVGPLWQSPNELARRRGAAVLDAGGIGAFGLSEKDHGADIYATDMVLTPTADGAWTASGSKYYIGDSNIAGIVSVFGRIDGVEGPDQYVWFFADSGHPNYHVVKNIVPAQMFVGEFRLDDYPVAFADVLHTGSEAFDAALNTVNIGKFNLCFAGIGMAEHSLYEAITHAHNRVLYGKRVTEFPHVRRQLLDAYARTVAAKLFSCRAIDYMRTASPEDRRYLLFNPVTKMKCTTEAQKAIALVADVVAAKGFEKDNYLAIAKLDIDGLPKLEGTVAVNLALIAKFMPAYLFKPGDYEPVPTRQDAADDEFLFRQGPARGLGSVQFHRWQDAYEPFAEVPNVARFLEQAQGLVTLLLTAPPQGEQLGDLDASLALTEMFTLIVYGHLILEQAAIVDVDRDLIDQMFDTFVRDFSAAAVEFNGKAGVTDEQAALAMNTVRRPVADTERFARVWAQVEALSGAYEMNP